MVSTYPSDVEMTAVRPQSVMLSFLGLYLRAREVAVSTGSLIDVFGRVGVGEEAVRSTAVRMVKRGLLTRHPRGRKAYVGLTPRSASVLEEGHRRMWEQGAVNRTWDGTWTVVAFSLPDGRRSERHDLRTRLQWSGFGPLQGGLWVAAGRHDVPAALAPLELDEHLVTLTGEALAPTQARDVVRRAFDTDAIAAEYDRFLQRWDGSGTVADDLPDDLARQLLLHTDWLGALRHDPHLPLEELPDAWPAVEAEHVFRELASTWERSADHLAEEALDLIEITTEQT
jgi:phenylacetic acid degradation operon negative regulatory protein